MTQFENLNLKMENCKCLHVNLEYLQKYKDDILSFLDGEVYMQSLRFATSTMLSDEIKTNNEIEGMNDNILEIHEVTHNKNSVSKEKYFHCHTDITIPYDELSLIEIVRKDNTTEKIIVDGRFVLPGTEELNEAFTEN